jgi:hypothetical protein
MSKLEIDRDYIKHEKKQFDSLRNALFDGLDGDDLDDVMASHNMMKSIFYLTEAMGALKTHFVNTGVILQREKLIDDGDTYEHPVFKGHCDSVCKHEDEDARNTHNETLKAMKELIGLLKK